MLIARSGGCFFFQKDRSSVFYTFLGRRNISYKMEREIGVAQCEILFTAVLSDGVAWLAADF